MAERNFKRVLEAGAPNEKVHMLEDSEVVALCGKSLYSGARWRKVVDATKYERCSVCARRYHFIKIGEANGVQVEAKTAG